jgi:hypothetical protein
MTKERAEDQLEFGSRISDFGIEKSTKEEDPGEIAPNFTGQAGQAGQGK